MGWDEDVKKWDENGSSHVQQNEDREKRIEWKRDVAKWTYT